MSCNVCYKVCVMSCNVCYKVCVMSCNVTCVVVLCDCPGQTKAPGWAGRNAFERNHAKKSGLLLPSLNSYCPLPFYCPLPSTDLCPLTALCPLLPFATPLLALYTLPPVSLVDWRLNRQFWLVKNTDCVFWLVETIEDSVKAWWHRIIDKVLKSWWSRWIDKVVKYGEVVELILIKY